MVRYRGANMQGRSLNGIGILQPPPGWTRTYRPDGSWFDSKEPGRIEDLPEWLRPSGPLRTLAEARAEVVAASRTSSKQPA